MNLILFILGCLTVIAIILVFLLHASYPTKKFIIYLPSIVLIVAGVIVAPASRVINIGMGLGLVGLIAFIMGVVVLLITIIVDLASKN